jgi:hypothetical protein
MKPSSTGQNNTYINFVLMARFDVALPAATLRDALNRLKGRQRAFDLRSSCDMLNPCPPRTGAYLLRVLPDCTAEDWRTVSAEELAQPFDASGPLVRFVLLERAQEADLLVVCDHGVSDGLSGFYLLRDLVELLNQPGHHLLPLPLPPTVWEVLPRAIRQSMKIRLLMTIVNAALGVMKWNKNRRKTTFPSHHFLVSSAELSACTTTALVDRCRVEQTSVHAAVCAALMLAVKAELPIKDVTKFVSKKKSSAIRSVSSPISLRGLLPLEMRESAGLFYTTVETNVRCDESRTFWSIAREIKKKMQQAEKTSSFYTTPLFLQSMFEYLASLPEGAPFHMPEMPIRYDFSVTNLGRLDADASNMHYQIKALYGPMVNALSGERTIGVCTLGGQIRFVLTTFADDMRPSMADILVQCAIQELVDAVQRFESF